MQDLLWGIRGFLQDPCGNSGFPRISKEAAEIVDRTPAQAEVLDPVSSDTFALQARLPWVRFGLSGMKDVRLRGGRLEGGPGGTWIAGGFGPHDK